MILSLMARKSTPCFLPSLVGTAMSPDSDYKWLIYFSGSVLSTTNEEGLSHTSLTERHCDWDETGFVLALEILESGSAGKFYIICNLTRQNEWEELTDEDVFGDYWLRRLCGEDPQFTIAQVEGQGLDLIKDSWAKASEEQEEIRLSVLSTLRPEIVETGLAKDGHDRRLVALYPSWKKSICN